MRNLKQSLILDCCCNHASHTLSLSITQFLTTHTHTLLLYVAPLHAFVVGILLWNIYVYQSIFRHAQPNIRRTFPGSSSRSAADHDDDDDEQPPSIVHRATGKQFGKALRPPGDDDEDDDDDDDSEDDDSEDEEAAPPQQQQQYVVRGAGKQLAGSGKYLRP